MRQYCQVFVDTVESDAQFARRLSTVVGGELLADLTLTWDHVEVDVRRSDLDRHRPPSSFLDYPLFLDVVPAGEALGDDRFVVAVTALLAVLAGMEVSYVAACDFEDRLPGAGRSPTALWPTAGTPLSGMTRHRLARAGWSEDRSIDVDPVIQQWAADHYPVNQPAAEFLRSFGFLELRYPHSRDPTHPDGCHFDAIRATSNVSPETVRWWGERVSAPLVPIGEAFTGHVTLVMAADGTVYGGYDHYLWRIGAHGEEAIEALCSGREPLLLPEPDDQPPVRGADR